MGKHAHRGAWVGGLALAGAATVAAILLLKNKSAAAQPVLPPVTPPSGPVLNTPIKQTADAMNTALTARGYNLGDAGIYKAFQSAAGLSPVDGYPGTNTGRAFQAAIASIPEAISPNFNPNYTFASGPGFDGTHAPLPAQWFGASYTGSTAVGSVADPSAYKA